MNWYLLAVSVYVMLITPLRLEALFSFNSGSLPECYIALLIWNTRLSAHVALRREADGHLALTVKRRSEKKTDGQKQMRGALRVLRAIKTADKARKTLWRAIHLRFFSAFVIVGFQDAALTARVTGALQALFYALPPAFGHNAFVRANFRGGGAARVRCILSARLGMLLSAAMLALLAYLASIREEKRKWEALRSAT